MPGLKRNSNRKGAYSFEYAQGMAELRKERLKKPQKLLPPVKKEIAACLSAGMVATADRGQAEA
jgi:IS30 family transposase